MTRRPPFPVSFIRAGFALAFGAVATFATEAHAQGGGGLPRIMIAPPAPSGWGGMVAAPSMPGMSAPRGYITTPGTSSGRGYARRPGDLPRLATAPRGYGAYGRGYGTASGAVGGSRTGRAPYTRWGVGSGCAYSCLSSTYGTHIGRYRKFIIGYPLYGVPIFYPYYYDVGYGGYSEVTTEPYAAEPRAAPKVIVVGTGSAGASDALTVESLGDSVRLSWLPNGRPAREVKLFVADSAKRELATRSPMPSTPTAIFEVATLAAPVAYVGVTVVFADGVSSTTLVPYRGDVTRLRPR